MGRLLWGDYYGEITMGRFVREILVGDLYGEITMGRFVLEILVSDLYGRCYGLRACKFIWNPWHGEYRTPNTLIPLLPIIEAVYNSLDHLFGVATTHDRIFLSFTIAMPPNRRSQGPSPLIPPPDTNSIASGQKRKPIGTSLAALIGALMEALVCCSGLHGCSALVGARVSAPIAALL